MGLTNFVRKILIGDEITRRSVAVDEEIRNGKDHLAKIMADSERSVEATRQNAQILQSQSRVMHTMSGMLEINRRGGT